MPYFESDPHVLDWFDRALLHPTAHIRRQAVMLLEHVDSVHRDRWLDRAHCDADASVAASAVITAAIIAAATDRSIDLYESDLASGVDAEDLQWEWEYALIVCDRFTIPATQVLAWTKEEDDVAAREIALLKCYVGKEHEKCNATAVIVAKRLVTRYTRSPRSFAEATQWHHKGRPRYPGV